jgi:hypothetical protein
MARVTVQDCLEREENRRPSNEAVEEWIEASLKHGH